MYRTLGILPTNNLFKHLITLESYYKSEYIVPPRNSYNFWNVKLKLHLYFNLYGERHDKVAIPRIIYSVPTVLRSR